MLPGKDELRVQRKKINGFSRPNVHMGEGTVLYAIASERATAFGQKKKKSEYVIHLSFHHHRPASHHLMHGKESSL